MICIIFDDDKRSKMKLRKAKYLDSHLSIEVRAKDLIRRMTLEEKIKQLCGILRKGILENGKISFQKTKKVIDKGIGQIGGIQRPFGPKEGAEIANDVQRFVIEHTRLGIPVIIHDECLHGCMAKGSTIFPQAIGLASTWNPELMEKIARAIGKETRARGIQQALSPTIDMARDPRCGRVEETYGEDPYLTSCMAVSFVRELQSQKVIATPKHFAANFVGDGGRDSNAIHVSERMLREIYLPAFEACVKEAGALSIMAAYNSLDGSPCSCNKWLLTDILRKEWKFKGIVVSDYDSVPGIYKLHNVAKTRGEAAKKAIEAGLDIEFPNTVPSSDCFGELVKLVKRGELRERVIDESVSRVLRMKLWLGLFENPYVDPEYAAKVCDSNEHRKLALKVAKESIVLLKNNNILPLFKNLKAVAVIGPNANEARLGGYSGSGIKLVTPLEGIKNKVSKITKIYFAEGCKIKGDSKEGFKEAIEITKKSDIVILLMGNSLETEGEARDRYNLDLSGVQEDLIKEICKVNKNVVVVLINGSAITMSKWLNNVKAVIESWYPGEEGGNAIADVIFGDYNPGGKLPISFPIFTGQLPLYYNHKPTGRVYDYVDLRGKQTLFPFGYGLSYTNFNYKNFKIKKTKNKRKLCIKVSLEVKNTGKYKGDEVVQLYIRDVVSSLSRPVKELRGFKRITLDANETKNIEFILGEEDFSYLGSNLKPVLESGTFEIMIGSSSEDIRLRGNLVI